MSVTNAERRLVVLALLAEFDEDAAVVARFVRALRNAAPGIDWAGELDTQARAWRPFTDRGLSIDWWLEQVVRHSA